MTATIDLETKKESDRRLALLALTGNQPKASGSCLDAEQLACLVEGRLEPENVESCLAHLAECEPCYATWRQLDQEWQQRAGVSRQSRGTLLNLFHRPRLLAATGSILAIAASIALFFNITMQTNRNTLMQLPAIPMQEQKQLAPPVESAVEPVNKQSGILEQAAAPAPSQLAKQREKKALSRTDRVQAPEQEAVAPAKAQGGEANRADSARRTPLPAVSATPPNTMGTASVDKRVENKGEPSDEAWKEAAPATPQQTMQAAAPLPENGVAAGPLTVPAWQRIIREGCQEQPGPDFFAGLTVQGKLLLAQNNATTLAQEDRRQISRILRLLADQHQQPATQQCRALLNLLGPAAGNDKQ